MKIISKIISLLFILICLKACSAGVDKQKISQSFNGILSLYDCNETLPQVECVKSVSIIHIHGMGVHNTINSKHPSEVNILLRDKLAKSLDFDEIRLSTGQNEGWLYINEVPDSNSIQAGKWSSYSYSDGDRNLNYLEINWDLITRKIQRSMLDLDVSLANFHDKNSRLKENYPNVTYANKHLKDILDVGFSDAVIYIGGLRPILQELIIDGLKEIMEHQGKSWRLESQNNHKVVLIADSLGSTLTFDTLMRIKESESESELKLYRLFNAKIKQLYLNANQLPLLEMSRLEKNDLGRIINQEPATLIGRNCKKENEKSRLGFVDDETKLQVVSFTDKNDALSYKITNNFLINYLCLPTVAGGSEIDESQIKWIDIPVTNGSTIPFLFVNPTTAHTSGFKRNNNEAINLMVNGFEVDN